MNPLDLFNQVKELIETKDFEAQQLISGSEGLDGLVSKIKGFF